MFRDLPFKTSRSFVIFVLTLAAITLLQPGALEAARLACSRVNTRNGRDSLQNNCGVCRVVNIQRQRPGSAAPVSRTVIIPARTTIGLSFRGPGRTRIISDRACKVKNRAYAKNPNTARNGDLKYLKLHRTVNGVALVNTGAQCRVAIVERLDRNGGRRMQTLAVGGNNTIRLPAKRAADVKIIAEKSCR